jgi:DNA-binding CsgD family transcriptional regulator
MFVRDSDYHAALTLLGAAAEARNRGEFSAIVLPHLRELFASDEASYGEIDVRTWQWHQIEGYPTTPRDLPGAAATVYRRPTEHPWLARWVMRGGNAAVRLSTLYAPQALLRLPYYAEFYRPRGVRWADYLVISRTPDRLAGVGVLRADHDYTDDEHNLAERLRVPLGRIWRQVDRAERLEAVLAAHTDVPADLTPAETRVVTLLAHGLPNTTIADALQVSVKAVEQHLTHVYRKVGVHSRAQLIAELGRRGDDEHPDRPVADVAVGPC